MSFNQLFKTLSLLFISLFFFIPMSYSGSGGIALPDSDSVASGQALFYFFDLRERESFIQFTNLGPEQYNVHVQIWDVGNNCNENNFFDTYTIADTHVYNMRDIITNDGNPSGVVLPDNAYGFVSIIDFVSTNGDFTGNFRIIDATGYEYRTNALNPFSNVGNWDDQSPNLTFNYNTEGNVTLSDVVGITYRNRFVDGVVAAADILDIWISFDVDIYNLDEVPFSCRNVIFACTDQDNPLYQELLDQSGDASVASFEYGVNDSLPHSRDGELLCPGNNISDGFVTLNVIEENVSNFIGFIGLNNGNSRGSMDSFWYSNPFSTPQTG